MVQRGKGQWHELISAERVLQKIRKQESAMKAPPISMQQDRVSEVNAGWTDGRAGDEITSDGRQERDKKDGRKSKHVLLIDVSRLRLSFCH